MPEWGTIEAIGCQSSVISVSPSTKKNPTPAKQPEWGTQFISPALS